MQYISSPTEFKALSAAGEFEGFASVYNNIGLDGDVVERGAFQQFEKTADGFIRVLYQHEQANRRKRNG